MTVTKVVQHVVPILISNLIFNLFHYICIYREKLNLMGWGNAVSIMGASHSFPIVLHVCLHQISLHIPASSRL